MIIASPELIKEARGWMLDCSWKEDPEELDEFTDQQVLLGVHHHYSGGLAQFARDGSFDEPEGLPPRRTNH